MSSMSTRRQRGSVLVQVALMVVVLLLFVGLAVDAGNLYAQRRRMQNAADAAALAGARAICFGGDPLAQAYEYAVTRNGAASAQIQLVDADTLRVTASIPTALRFAALAGLASVNVSARSTAMCGVACSAGGLWPVALNERIWDWNCGKEFYVWDDDKDVKCSQAECAGDPNCVWYDCDVDGDGQNDIVAGGDRGWLDFSEVIDPLYQDPCAQPGCGQDELRCYILRDYAALINLPACIPGDSGVKAASWLAAGQRKGARVRIPLFDYIGCAAGHTCPGGLQYHVIRAGCATVVDATTVELRDNTGKKYKGKVIAMRIDCTGCATSTGRTCRIHAGPKDLRAASLID